MFVYANLLGEWKKLTEHNSINGYTPTKFIENILLTPNNSEELELTNNFVEVLIDNEAYHIHISCIQFTYKR